MTRVDHKVARKNYCICALLGQSHHHRCGPYPSAMVSFLGLDRIMHPGSTPAQLQLKSNGTLAGQLAKERFLEGLIRKLSHDAAKLVAVDGFLNQENLYQAIH